MQRRYLVPILSGILGAIVIGTISSHYEFSFQTSFGIPDTYVFCFLVTVTVLLVLLAVRKNPV